jgi:hypothetical protein
MAGWQNLNPGEDPEFILAQRADFYVLLAHRPGWWQGFIGEGQYVSPPGSQPRWEGGIEDTVREDAEKYIRWRDPSWRSGDPD